MASGQKFLEPRGLSCWGLWAPSHTPPFKLTTLAESKHACQFESMQPSPARGNASGLHAARLSHLSSKHSEPLPIISHAAVRFHQEASNIGSEALCCSSLALPQDQHEHFHAAYTMEDDGPEYIFRAYTRLCNKETSVL